MSMSTADIIDIGEDKSPPVGAAEAVGAAGVAGAAGQQGLQGSRGCRQELTNKCRPPLHQLPHSHQELPPV